MHLIARNEGPTPARIVSAGCGGFSVRLYRSARELERGTGPVWENRLGRTAYGPDPAQVVFDECDFMAWALDLPPGQTRARVATHVSPERIRRAVSPRRYVVALGYRPAGDGPVRLLRAGCLTLGRGVALSIGTPNCTEWSARELREVLAAEVTRAARSRRTPPGPAGSWFEFQVSPAARLIDSSESVASVPYPAELRAAAVRDTVLVQFVMDSTGYVVPGTVRVIHARYQAAADAVQAAVASWRHHPAKRRGRRVRQLVQVSVPVVR